MRQSDLSQVGEIKTESISQLRESEIRGLNMMKVLEQKVSNMEFPPYLGSLAQDLLFETRTLARGIEELTRRFLDLALLIGSVKRTLEIQFGTVQREFWFDLA